MGIFGKINKPMFSVSGDTLFCYMQVVFENELHNTTKAKWVRSAVPFDNILIIRECLTDDGDVDPDTVCIEMKYDSGVAKLRGSFEELVLLRKRYLVDSISKNFN